MFLLQFHQQAQVLVLDNLLFRFCCITSINILRTLCRLFLNFSCRCGSFIKWTAFLMHRFSRTTLFFYAPCEIIHYANTFFHTTIVINHCYKGSYHLRKTKAIVYLIFLLCHLTPHNCGFGHSLLQYLFNILFALRCHTSIM